MYSSIADMSNISASTLIKAKIFPDNMVDNGSVRNSFRGNVVVQPSNYSQGSYKLIYYNVPRVECARISAAVFDKFAQVQVNGLVVKSNAQTMTVSDVLSKIVGMCTDTNNTLYFNSF